MDNKQLEKLARELNFRVKKFVDEMPDGVSETAVRLENLVRKHFRGDSLTPGRILALVVKLARELTGRR